MPNHPTYKLGEIANVLDSFRKPINAAERTRRIQGKEEKDLYPYFGATGQVGYIDEYLTDGEYVLVGEDGAPFLEPFKNKSYIIQGKAWVNNHAHILSGKENVSCNKYLCHFLNSFDYRGYVNGTTRLKLTQGNLVEIPIPLPPLAIQQAIVSRIESLFAELDKGVEKLKTAQQQLKVYRQAVLNDCLTKGSEKWENVKLGDIILNMRNGYGKKPTDNGKYRILRISSVRPMNIDFSDYRNNSTDFADNDKIKPNNLLFTRYNGSKEFVGVCASVPNIEEQYAYPDKIICCTLKCDNQYHSKYLQYYLNQGEALAFIRSKIKTTSGQNGIAGSDLKKVTIFLPPLSTQQRIVQEIETRLSACDEVEKNIAESLQQSEALRQSILKKAFSGELVASTSSATRKTVPEPVEGTDNN